MKVKGVSFSIYKVKVNTYVFDKLDLFTFLFTQIVLDEHINKDMKVIDCLLDLDIKEDLHYLFNNVYYKLVDNLVIKDTKKEDINELLIKDIQMDKRFINYLKQGYLPILNNETEKEFVYDYLNNKVVLANEYYTDSNVCVIELENNKESIEEIINDNKKNLFDINDGICILNDFVVDPYYFEIHLKEKDNYYFVSSTNKEMIYNALCNNSLFVKEDINKGEFLSNNIYFKCLFSKNNLIDYCDYLFVYDKEKEFNVMDNVIYVNYDFDGDFVDLINKEKYITGKYLLENNKYMSTFNKEKCKEVSEFKLYLLKNKEKFTKNINKVIELIQELSLWIIIRF